MPICVKSEIQPLKKVLLHRPGQELEHLIPGALERLLFDDIPYLAVAQQEHDFFAQVLREHGTQVVYLSELCAQTLADEETRQQFIADFIRASGNLAQRYQNVLTEYLSAIRDPMQLVLKTMAGISFAELGPDVGGPLSARLHRDSHFLTDPIPNLYFTRDPFACIGRGVTLHRMYSFTRNRETIYGQYILSHHPDFAGQVPFYYTPAEPFSMEGGDILNLSPEVLAVGISQRTKPEAIERMAENVFSDEQSTIRTILAMSIPNVRAYMHLDTVMTMVDKDKFIIHPGILETLRVFEITPGNPLRVRELHQPLADILHHYLGQDQITLIHCGGMDTIASQREQWNDGSNTLCIAPGTVIAYNRNYVTNRLLEDHGVTVLTIPGSELSRGRGGPRCMSMPLIRE